MECHCRISGSDALTTPCYGSQILVTRILREDLEDNNVIIILEIFEY